jgi:tRNA(fMet)-specific endonuclease VapC
VKYLMDTDHVSILQDRSEPGFTAILGRIGRISPTEFGYSIISFHEQVVGGHTYINRARGLDGVVRGYGILGRVLKDFAATAVMPFDDPASAVFARLSSQRVRVATLDLRIASIALSLGLILLTRNRGDFGRVPGLVTEDWTV